MVTSIDQLTGRIQSNLPLEDGRQIFAMIGKATSYRSPVQLGEHTHANVSPQGSQERIPGTILTILNWRSLPFTALSIIFAKAKSFEFLLFVFARWRINLLSARSPNPTIFIVRVGSSLFASPQAIPEMQIFRCESRDNKLARCCLLLLGSAARPTYLSF